MKKTLNKIWIGLKYISFFTNIKIEQFPYDYPPRSLYDDKERINNDFINAIMRYEKN